MKARCPLQKSDIGGTPPNSGGSTGTGESPSAPPPTGVEDEDTGRLRGRVRHARSTVDETKRSLLERAERESDRHESVRALFRVVEEDRGRGGGLLAGGLAYRMFIWILPASLAATSALDVFANAEHHSPAEAAKGLGMGAAVAATVGQAAARSGGATPILLITGLALMLWASRGVLKAMRLVSSLAWSMRPSPLGSATRPTLATACVLMVFSLYGFVVAPLYRGSLPTDLVATVLAVVGIVTISVWAIGGASSPGRHRSVSVRSGSLPVRDRDRGLEVSHNPLLRRKVATRGRPLRSGRLRLAVFMTYLYLVARLAVLASMVNASLHQVTHPQSSASEAP